MSSLTNEEIRDMLNKLGICTDSEIEFYMKEYNSYYRLYNLPGNQTREDVNI